MKRKYFFILGAIICLAAGLRFPFLEHFPPSLYSDEVSQGYNAYSILRTGRDEYGTFLPISFRSFGDWKPPLQTYLMIPTIAVFGLNAYGVRLPSAILGTLTVALTYFLTNELLQFKLKSHSSVGSESNSELISLLSAGLLAISPWHIMQSRSAMLVCIELFFLTLAVLTFLKGLKNSGWWYVSCFAWVLAFYAYYGMRLIVPFFLLFLAVEFRKEIIRHIAPAISTAALGFILLLPLLFAFINEPNVLLGRAKTVSIFYDKGVSLTTWDLITQDGTTISPRLAQLFHNKPYAYALDITRRFFQHFDGRFLFLIGDTQLPFQIPAMGVLYFIDGLFLITGLVFLIKTNRKLFVFLLFWIFISVIPAAFTFVTPAANRTFTMVIPLMILTSLGIAYGYKNLTTKIRLVGSLGLISVYLLSFGYFGFNYFLVLPKQHANWWHFGYKELYAYLRVLEPTANTIAISAKASVPYIFLLFYEQIDPKIAQRQVHHNFELDEFGFEHVDSFKTYIFPRHFSWEKDGQRLPNHAILVTTPREVVGSEAHQIKTIDYPNGETAFKIYRIEI